MMGKWRHLHQNFVTVANYINCNIFVKIWRVFSVVTRLPATKLCQGLIFNGIWHTKLKFTFSKVVTQHPSKDAAAKIVQYYKQNNSINYISSTDVSKWFHSNKELVWSDLGRNGTLIFGPLWNVWNFRKKLFFSKFEHFILFCEWFKCYFWIPHPKVTKSTNFHKNLVNQTQNMNENALRQISKMAAERTKEKDRGPNFWLQYLRNYLREKLETWYFYLSSHYVHMLQIVGFRHVPLWCGISPY